MGPLLSTILLFLWALALSAALQWLTGRHADVTLAVAVIALYAALCAKAERCEREAAPSTPEGE